MKKSMAVGVLSAALLCSSGFMSASQIYAASAAVQKTSLTGIIQYGVNFRSGPSTSFKIIRLLKTGETVTILDQSNAYFYKVKTSDGKTGYVSSSEKYIKLNKETTVKPGNSGGSGNKANAGSNTGNIGNNGSSGSSKSGNAENSGNPGSNNTGNAGSSGGSGGSVNPGGSTNSGGVGNTDNSNASNAQDERDAKLAALFDTGRKYLGTPYEYGSDRNTTETFDCSDFARTIYREALGIILPADSRSQGQWIKDNSQAVYDIKDLRPGDLLFFMSNQGTSDTAYQDIDKSTERITHVAVYMGNGQMIQTYSVASGGVRIDTLSGSWVKRFLFGGSVLQ
ncbi:C40 family peptidase [Paenibacillus sp. J22TS3]|uniref:C40 family peptidase n=1 Tax=Paenibacillus sp. J22TS3 TaxID=2807192 RepID=UPI001AFE3DF3|nr:C40 family peptidase [Paenibacillus sp. J22TS3]GIP24415.1 hypothetical protein J22TS3_46900 [Paenibacillus sp. J22TS3]